MTTQQRTLVCGGGGKTFFSFSPFCLAVSRENSSRLLVAVARYVALFAASVAGLAVFGALAGDVSRLAAVVASQSARAKTAAASASHATWRASAHTAATTASTAAGAKPTSTTAGAVRVAERRSPAIAAVSLRALAGEVAGLVAGVALLAAHVDVWSVYWAPGTTEWVSVEGWQQGTRCFSFTAS